jgi:hypothetical protein
MTNVPLGVVPEGRDRSDLIEVTPAMIEAGVDLAVDLGVENVSLETFVEDLYRRMVFASRGQMHRSHHRPSLTPFEISSKRNLVRYIVH